MSILLAISKYAVPFTIGFIVIYGMLKRVPIYEAFLEGAKDGFKIVVDLAPTLLGLLLAVSIIRVSGLLLLISSFFTPVAKLFNIPAELFPVAIVRLFSSSAATGMTLDIFRSYGPDSFIGRAVSIMMSSTETVFYTMSVYFMAAGIQKTRWTLAGAMLSSVVGFILSVLLS